MKNKFYKQMDKKVDAEIEKARADRIRFYGIQKKRLKSSKEVISVFFTSVIVKKFLK